MLTYKPAKRSAVMIYFLLTLVLIAVTAAIFLLIPLIGDYDFYIAIGYWIFHAFCSCVLIPYYFKHSYMKIYETEIVQTTGMLTLTTEVMPMNSVMSVTTIITPFSKVTGLNFIIVNALGSRVKLAFMRKNDCLEATDFINSIIRSRGAK